MNALSSQTPLDPSAEPVLYDYWRSTASYRVRIALNLTGIAWRSVTVNLVSGEQRSDEHKRRNPQGLVPVLDIDGHRLTQSLAIIDYLNTSHQLGLLPENPIVRAHVQALAHTIAIDLHPVCNLSVMTQATGGEEPARTDWMQHFIGPGLTAFEALLGHFEQAPFCTGTQVSLADLCLIPQLYNAERWGVDYSNLPRIKQVAHTCANHPAFIAAHPDAVRAN